MENLKIKVVFFNYYSATLGRFYSTSQKERILKLIATANGVEKDKIDALINASRYIENEDIGNPVGCKNFLLYAFFRTDVSQELFGAVSALNEIFTSNQPSTAHTNELVWHRTVQKEGNALEIGYYEYARGRNDRAIDSFEKSMRTEKKLPLVEYLAIITDEAKDYLKSYEYALKAQVISEDERLNIDWLMEIENKAKEHLTAAEREKIEKSVFTQKNTSRIGFGQ